MNMTCCLYLKSVASPTWGSYTKTKHNSKTRPLSDQRLGWRLGPNKWNVCPGEGDRKPSPRPILLRMAPACPFPSLPEDEGEAVRSSERSVGAMHQWAGYQAGAVLARRLIRLVFLSWSRIFFSISASVRVSSSGHHWSASPVFRMAISTVGRGFSLKA